MIDLDSLLGILEGGLNAGGNVMGAKGMGLDSLLSMFGKQGMPSQQMNKQSGLNMQKPSMKSMSKYNMANGLFSQGSNNQESMDFNTLIQMLLSGGLGNNLNTGGIMPTSLNGLFKQ